MAENPSTVREYLASLPAEQRAVVEAVRKLVRNHLPKGYEEAFAWGGISWQVPLATYPDTYNGQPLVYAGLGARKGSYSLYLMGPYGDPAQAKALADAYRRAGRKLDMGKSCVRFRSLDDLVPEAIAQVVAAMPVDEYVAFSKAIRERSKAARAAGKARPATAAAKSTAKTRRAKPAAKTVRRRG